MSTRRLTSRTTVTAVLGMFPGWPGSERDQRIGQTLGSCFQPAGGSLRF
jgi:hypothetical protein